MIENELGLFQQGASILYAAALSDILDELGFRHQVAAPGLRLQPLQPHHVVLGRALTLRNDFETRVEEPYALAIEAMDRIRPGEVLVAETPAALQAGVFGELSATRLRARQGQGAVIDGFTRDCRKLIEMNFPVFCRGSSPIDTVGRSRVVDWNVPIQLGTLTVSPGQIIFADLDGVIVLPPEAEEEVLSKALHRAEVESHIREELKSGVSLDSIWDKYGVL